MEAFKSEHERLQQQFDQIANRKLLALTEKGHVFELSSGNRAASAQRRQSTSDISKQKLSVTSAKAGE